MSRRHREEGATLESDSFLDIVANIVGILIILIVVAGVRVGQSTAVPAPEVVEAPAPPALRPVVAPRPLIVATPAPDPLPAPEASPVLLASIDATRQETDRLRAEHATLAAESDRLGAAAVAIAAYAGEAAVTNFALTEQLAAADAAGRHLAIEIDRLRSTLDGLGRQISDAPTEKVTILRHRLNPIGREVRGEELHFRVAEGRVALVPIQELVERLKPEIERQKDWIAKYHRHQGHIGPIRGFTMEYVVERQRLSVVEELRQGVQMMRIVVSGWKVVPEPDLRTETPDEALRGDSRFLSALRLADRNAALTFWVYPDSFDAYRRLQDAAHTAGFAVAARPLPPGVPIAGSPSGTRSSSQ